MVSPITGELIPVDQMAEHMRISLIDPKFQEQRQAMMSKIRETTKASDDEIGRNLVGLASKRPDVFGASHNPTWSLLSFMHALQAGIASLVQMRWPSLAAQDCTTAGISCSIMHSCAAKHCCSYGVALPACEDDCTHLGSFRLFWMDLSETVINIVLTVMPIGWVQCRLLHMPCSAHGGSSSCFKLTACLSCPVRQPKYRNILLWKHQIHAALLAFGWVPHQLTHTHSHYMIPQPDSHPSSASV